MLQYTIHSGSMSSFMLVDPSMTTVVFLWEPFPECEEETCSALCAVRAKIIVGGANQMGGSFTDV